MVDLKDVLMIFECPKCRKGDLYIKEDLLICAECGKKYQMIDGIPDLTLSAKDEIAGDDNTRKRSFSRWNEFYSADDEEKDRIGFGELAAEHVDIFRNMKIIDKISGEDLVLDIGCGKGYVPHALSKIGKVVIGVDFILEPLLFAKRKFEREGLNGLFVRADMFNLPFKRNIFKFVYSLGVLEHHKDMTGSAREIFRVTRDDGISLNIVPAISIPSLTYAQMWGSIPNIYLLKDIFYWFHHKLLKGKHCIYGYELNYSESQLKKIFREAGFEVNISKAFNITVPIYSMKNPFLKSLAKEIIKNRLFTRHIYVHSEKSGRGHM